MRSESSWSINAFVIVAFATWRCTTLLLYEQGPFRVFTALRRILVRSVSARLATCFDCSSIWISAALIAVTYRVSLEWIVLIPAIAGGARLIELLAASSYQSDDAQPDEDNDDVLWQTKQSGRDDITGDRHDS